MKTILVVLILAPRLTTTPGQETVFDVYLDHDGQQPAILGLLKRSRLAVIPADDPLDPDGQLGSVRGQPFTSFRGKDSSFGRLTVLVGHHGFT